MYFGVAAPDASARTVLYTGGAGSYPDMYSRGGSSNMSCYRISRAYEACSGGVIERETACVCAQMSNKNSERFENFQSTPRADKRTLEGSTAVVGAVASTT